MVNAPSSLFRERYSPDKIIITLNFTDRYDTPDITPDYIKDIEKQSETEAAFPLPQSSNILASFPPDLRSAIRDDLPAAFR